MDLILDGIVQALRLVASLDAEVMAVTLLSLKVSCSATVVSLLLGMPAGTLLALARFPGRRLVISLINTGMGLPPVVVGLFVTIFLWRNGPFGYFEILYTPIAMVLAQTATTGTAAAEATMKKSLGMNKDDFMKLFIAQLKYQDPLKPQDPSAMLDQLSQLSLVEQSYNSNTALNNLLTAQNNSMSLTAVSFIGKDVKANGNTLTFDGSSSSKLEFNLPLSAKSSQVSILDGAGKTVRTVSLGSLKSGDNSYSWDGRDNNGALLSAGAYSYAVTATSANGSAITASTYVTGKIDGVDLSGTIPQLTIGSTSVALSDVISLGV